MGFPEEVEFPEETGSPEESGFSEEKGLPEGIGFSEEMAAAGDGLEDVHPLRADSSIAPSTNSLTCIIFIRVSSPIDLYGMYTRYVKDRLTSVYNR
ncbi:hypothetical protein KCTCHS21_02340 [Cohnella abietis]|uniref:Uncharacterized protein n=1 Tax=Cohnella abietis TaxID=2507935 RepID=A0A3T1CYK6_9BACL|nr:hypothetical protein KCTCHS21_02340 [Cohnella abietis]